MSGHIIDMVNRIKQNKISKRKKFKGDNWSLRLTGKINESTEYSFPSLSESKLKQLKIELQENSRQNRRTSIYILIISLLFVSVVFLIFLKFYR